MRKFVLFTFFLFSVMAGHAQIVSSAEAQVIEKIRQGNLKHTTITCAFRQIQHLSFMGEEMLSEGKLYYTKPEKLAMHYTDPEGEVMAINGDKFVMLTIGGRKEMQGKSNPKMQGMKTILSACLQGDVLKMEATKITCKETAGHYVVTAIINTRTNQSGIREVVMNYDKTNSSLSVLKTLEEDDNYTIYELTDKKFNQPIAESKFLN